MRFCVAGRRSKVTLHDLAWRAWLVGHEGGARLHPHQRRMPGPGTRDPAPGLAVVAEVRGQGQPGDVVLSRGAAHGDELASQGQAAPNQATTARGSASLGNRRGATAPSKLQQRETVEQLYQAIHQLPKTDAALVLLYLDELSYREMAEVLGISESNVGVKLNRAKKALSELMKGNT